MSNANGRYNVEPESDEVSQDRLRLLSEDRKERIGELRDTDWGPLATGNYDAVSLKDGPPKSGWWTGPGNLVAAVKSWPQAIALCAVLAFLGWAGKVLGVKLGLF